MHRWPKFHVPCLEAPGSLGAAIKIHGLQWAKEQLEGDVGGALSICRGGTLGGSGGGGLFTRALAGARGVGGVAISRVRDTGGDGVLAEGHDGELSMYTMGGTPANKSLKQRDRDGVVSWAAPEGDDTGEGVAVRFGPRAGGAAAEGPTGARAVGEEAFHDALLGRGRGCLRRSS